MKHIKKLLLLIALSFSIATFAQKDRFFHQMGLGANFSTIIVEYTIVDDGFEMVTNDFLKGKWLISPTYKLRYNLLQDWKKSLGIVIAPSFSYGKFTTEMSNSNYELTGNHMYYIPITLQLSLGNGATYYNQSEKGFTVGIGMAYYKSPLSYDFIPDTDQFGNIKDIELKALENPLRKQFYFNIGYRRSKKIEFNLNVGLAGDESTVGISVFKSLWFEKRNRPLEKRQPGFSKKEWSVQRVINDIIADNNPKKHEGYYVYSYKSKGYGTRIKPRAFNKWKKKYGYNYHFFEYKVENIEGKIIDSNVSLWDNNEIVILKFLPVNEYDKQTIEIARIKKEKEIAREKARKQAEERKRLEKEKLVQKLLVIYNSEKKKAKYKAEQDPNIYFEEYSNGFYVGEIKNGQRNGYGKYVRKEMLSWAKECDFYEGEWVNGKKEGFGQEEYSLINLFFKERSVYIGQYKNDKRHGEGILNGDKVVYENGKIIKNYGEDKRQKELDVRNGEIDVPSYTTERDQYGTVDVEFSDNYSGRVFYNKSCGKYYLSITLSRYYYNSFSTAVKALYLYRTKMIIMNGHVSCN